MPSTRKRKDEDVGRSNGRSLYTAAGSAAAGGMGGVRRFSCGVRARTVRNAVRSSGSRATSCAVSGRFGKMSSAGAAAVRVALSERSANLSSGSRRMSALVRERRSSGKRIGADMDMMDDPGRGTRNGNEHQDKSTFQKTAVVGAIA